MLVLRLLITPLAVLLASLAQRHGGPAIGGRVVALPLTTGPFLLLLGMQSGSAATASAASGVVLGEMSVATMCGIYGLLAHRGVRSAFGWSLAATLACALATVVLRGTALWIAGPLVACTCLGFAIGQSAAASADPPRTVRQSEVLVRMVLTTTIVATLLALSTVLGPLVAGTLATLPVIISVMMPATHLRSGPNAAIALARGTLITLPATTAAVLVLAVAIVPLGPLAASALALVVLVAVDVATVGSMRSLDRYAGSRVDPLPA